MSSNNRKSWESSVGLIISGWFLAASGSFLLAVCGYYSVVTGPSISESCEPLMIPHFFISNRRVSLLRLPQCRDRTTHNLIPGAICHLCCRDPVPPKTGSADSTQISTRDGATCGCRSRCCQFKAILRVINHRCWSSMSARFCVLSARHLLWIRSKHIIRRILFVPQDTFVPLLRLILFI